MALAIFAFNNTQQQFAIREAGGISYSVFKDFLDSENENYVCEAAFQVSTIIRVASYAFMHNAHPLLALKICRKMWFPVRSKKKSEIYCSYL